MPTIEFVRRLEWLRASGSLARLLRQFQQDMQQIDCVKQQIATVQKSIETLDKQHLYRETAPLSLMQKDWYSRRMLKAIGSMRQLLQKRTQDLAKLQQAIVDAQKELALSMARMTAVSRLRLERTGEQERANRNREDEEVRECFSCRRS